MFCSRCGTELPEGAHACAICGVRKRKRPYLLLSLLLLVVVAAVVGAGTFFQHYSRMKDLGAKLEEAVGKDRGYTETIIKVEAEASSMTYAELFDLCQKSIDARTQIVVDLRGLYPNLKSDVRMQLIEFLNAENELIRQKSAYYRKSLALSASLDTYKDHVSDYPLGGYGWDYYNRRTSQLKGEMSEAAGEMLQCATEYTTTYRTLVDREASLATAMKKRNLRFVSIFQKYQESNVGIEQTARTAVQSLGV